MVDKERIKKLLNLTTSTFNGEALNAIRKANEELKRNKQTWDDVVGEQRLSHSSDVEALELHIDRLKEEIKEKDFRHVQTVQKMKSYIEDLKRACDFYKFASGIKQPPQQNKKRGGYKYGDGGYIPKSKRR